MTTAHRPTWNPAVGGENQSGNAKFDSKHRSAKDLPAHINLKHRCPPPPPPPISLYVFYSKVCVSGARRTCVELLHGVHPSPWPLTIGGCLHRQRGQGTADDIAKRDLLAELEDKERKHADKVGRVYGAPASTNHRRRACTRSAGCASAGRSHAGAARTRQPVRAPVPKVARAPKPLTRRHLAPARTCVPPVPGRRDTKTIGDATSEREKLPVAAQNFDDKDDSDSEDDDDDDDDDRCTRHRLQLRTQSVAFLCQELVAAARLAPHGERLRDSRLRVCEFDAGCCARQRRRGGHGRVAARARED